LFILSFQKSIDKKLNWKKNFYF